MRGRLGYFPVKKPIRHPYKTHLGSMKCDYGQQRYDNFKSKFSLVFDQIAVQRKIEGKPLIRVSFSVTDIFLFVCSFLSLTLHRYQYSVLVLCLYTRE